MARKKSPSKPYRILGQVTDKESHLGLAGLKVEAWDKDLIINDFVGSAITDAQGHIEIKFDAAYFQELFLDRKPDLFFKVYRGEELLLNTQDSMVCTIAPGDTKVTLEVDLPGEEPGEKTKVFVVRGRVLHPEWSAHPQGGKNFSDATESPAHRGQRSDSVRSRKMIRMQQAEIAYKF